jgi:N-acetylneuraminic acid mutarotase
MGGGKNATQPGVYGTFRVPAAGNIPGSRSSSCTWIDTNGKLWLFGGNGYDSTGNSSWGNWLPLNDLWQFDPSSNEWAWMSGSSTVTGAGVSGVYGILGEPAPGNVPGGRSGAACWSDAEGKLWLFGGGNNATGSNWFNDLWQFDPSTLQWSWMGGGSQPNQPGSYGYLGVSGTGNVPGARINPAFWSDRQGNFWLFGGEGYDGAGSQGYLNDLWKYAPAEKQWTWMGGGSTVGPAGIYGTRGSAAPQNVPGGRLSAMHWIDQAGKLWLFGGAGIDAASNFGKLSDLWSFDPSTGEWTWIAGSNASAGDGMTGTPGNYGALGVPAAASNPGARDSGLGWRDSSGKLWLFGGNGYDASGNLGALSDLWQFDPSAGEWTWAAGSQLVGGSGGQAGVYGTLGQSSGGYPGGRGGTAGWIDANGSVWLFGGYGYDSDDHPGYLNDLWRYSLPLAGLSISLSGTGAGSVTSSPVGIDCPGDCAANFGAGASVTLTATPASGSVFTGWNAGGCSTGSSCTVSASNQTITATFTALPKLTVVVLGGGDGVVTSTPGGIDCAASCQASLPVGTSLTLSATANTGSVFSGWGGQNCSGVNSCSVTFNANVTVYATFTAAAAGPSGGLPLIGSLSPALVTAGGSSFSLTILGSNFSSGSLVLWNGLVRQTTFVSPTELAATISTADIAAAQSAMITVVNPAPNAGSSAASPMAVQTSTPVAQISSLSISNQADENGSYALGAAGVNFLPTSAIDAGSTALDAVYISPWQLGAALPAADQGQPLTVENPAGDSPPFAP